MAGLVKAVTSHCAVLHKFRMTNMRNSIPHASAQSERQAELHLFDLGLSRFLARDKVVELLVLFAASMAEREHQLAVLTPFEVGQIKAHLEHGLRPGEIGWRVLKPEGSDPMRFTPQAIGQAIAKLERDPSWRGERAQGSGRPRKTSAATDAKIYKKVLKHRGKRKVTVSYLKQTIPELRLLSDSLVEERLHDAGLKYLRRRKKILVTKEYRQGRIDYCKWVKAQSEGFLKQFAYSDGTVFYLDRTSDELEQTQQAALGSHVWRHADRNDALYHDCIGPSCYNKGQGMPVRVWGLLSDGILNIHILEEGEVMDSCLYSELVEEKFGEWMLSTKYLVQDFERCLRTQEVRHSLQKEGIHLVEKYPKVSQDFNAIENAWKELRERLFTTLPKSLESRGQFIVRLKAAVLWLNKNRSRQLQYLSTNQKERADECLELLGGRTSW